MKLTTFLLVVMSPTAFSQSEEILSCHLNGSKRNTIKVYAELTGKRQLVNRGDSESFIDEVNELSNLKVHINGHISNCSITYEKLSTGRVESDIDCDEVANEKYELKVTAVGTRVSGGGTGGASFPREFPPKTEIEAIVKKYRSPGDFYYQRLTMNRKKYICDNKLISLLDIKHIRLPEPPKVPSLYESYVKDLTIIAQTKTSWTQEDHLNMGIPAVKRLKEALLNNPEFDKDGYITIYRLMGRVDNFDSRYHDEILNFLKQNRRIDVNATRGSRSLLDNAIYFNSIYILEFLLKNGVDPNMEDEDGDTPLIKSIDSARRYGANSVWDFSLMRLILDYGANIDYITTSGRSFLRTAKNMSDLVYREKLEKFYLEY